jgi:hypothetical protein
MSILVTLILLPIVPAFLLFAALPGDAAVSGPLKGFKINLSGAFAGYFSVVLLCISCYKIWQPQARAPVHKWTIRGRIVDTDGNPIQPLDVTNVTLSPPILQPANDGNFVLTFMETPTDDGQSLIYPKLVITANGYRARTIELDPAGWTGVTDAVRSQQEKSHTIDLANLQLERLPPYNPDPKNIKPVASNQ